MKTIFHPKLKAHIAVLLLTCPIFFTHFDNFNILNL